MSVVDTLAYRVKGTEQKIRLLVYMQLFLSGTPKSHQKLVRNGSTDIAHSSFDVTRGT